jgi:hypothetical protein
MMIKAVMEMKCWSGQKPFIATKAETIGLIEQWAMPGPVEVCFPPGLTTSDVEASLAALGVDSIVRFQMHRNFCHPKVL